MKNAKQKFKLYFTFVFELSSSPRNNLGGSGLALSFTLAAACALGFSCK